MLASIHSGSSTRVWPELLREASRHRCILFIFPGGRLGSRDEYEYMRNRIFDRVDGRTFDGALCWASSLSGFSSEKEVEEFLLSRKDLPLVTFGLKVRSTPAVTIDAYTGMKDLVFHLLRVHGRRRIAFIGGPLAHSSAEDRYRAYRDALAESGIGFDEMLVVPDRPWTGGREAALCLLETRGLQPGRDFDALCSASDLLTFKAAELLLERGCRIPSDVALAGFNDADESSLLSPTLTTVRMPFDRQALQAFRMLLARMRGDEPHDELLETRLIVRQSCGCLDESVQLAGKRRARRPDRSATFPVPGHAPELAALILKKLSRSHGSAGEGRSGLGAKEAGSIVQTFLAEIAGDGTGTGSFIAELSDTLDKRIHAGREIGPFQDLLSMMRELCLAAQPSSRQAVIVERLVHQGRVLVSDAGHRLGTYRAWQEKSIEYWLFQLNHELLCAKGIADIMRIAARCLPGVGIHEGYLVLEGGRFGGGFRPGIQGRDTKVLAPWPSDRRMTEGLLLPEALMPRQPGCYMVLPLHYESTALGWLVLEAGSSDAFIYEEIRAQVSSAIRGVLLFEEADELRRRAERAERLKTEFLANISGELQLPLKKIQESALRLLGDGQEEGKRTKEYDAILLSAGRQLELTRRLLDLSRAQVDELGFVPGLLDPRSILERLGSAPPGAGIGIRIGVDVPDRADFVPLLRGDPERLVQALSLLLEYLSEGLAPGSTVEASFETVREGPRFRLICPGREGVVRKAGEERIGLSLAQRIALLHGGRIDLESPDGKPGTVILQLPFPAFSRATATGGHTAELVRPGPEEHPRAVHLLTLGRPPEGLLESLFPGCLIQGPRLESSEIPDLIYLDPSTMDTSMQAYSRILVESPGHALCGCMIPSSALPIEPGGTEPGQPADLLAASIQEAAKQKTVLLLDSGRLRGEANVLPQSFQAAFPARLTGELAGQGVRIIHARSIPELSTLSALEEPALFLFAGRLLPSAEPFDSVLSGSAAPLLWVEPDFSDPAVGALLSTRPRSIACHGSEPFLPVILALARRLLNSGDALPVPTAHLVLKTLKILDARYRDSLSRWKIAAGVNTSEDYLSRIFHGQMGISLWDYLNRLRIRHAIDLLRTSGDSVADVASRAGFQDQAYFCRVFKRITGRTPGSMRSLPVDEVRKVQQAD
jgi:DNA-binding LacI/PurR family transcriptional regulator/AraC-like DNA-binding protein